jgi:peptide/nickel transport system substrate-binding protein
LNPVAVVGLHELTFYRVLFDTLMRVDKEGKPIPWAAEKINIVDDRTIDATLRSGMTFHDGKPGTAEDVKFSFEYYQKWKGGGLGAALKPVDRVEVRGPLSVRFHLKRPHAPFLSITLTSVYILPKHIWQGVPKSIGKEAPQDWDDWKKTAIGSGPFRFVSWKRGEELRMARHDAHWAKPKIDGILRITYADMQGLVFGIQKREIDVIGWNISPLQVRVLKNLGHVGVVNVPNHGYYPIHINLDRKPFDDLAFRRALAHAIPRKRIVNDFYEGFAVEAISPVGPMNTFWHNPKVPRYEFNLEKARQILKKAGYAWDSKGKLYYPSGKTN